MVLIFKTLTPYYLRMLYVKIWLNWPIFAGEDFFFYISFIYFRYFVISPLEKGHGPSFEQSGIPMTQGCFVPILFEIGQLVVEKIFFFWNSVDLFILFRNYLPLVKSPLPMEAMCQVWLKFTQWFSLFPNYLPLEEDETLHLNKFDFPSPKDALCQVWLKLGQWLMRRRF